MFKNGDILHSKTNDLIVIFRSYRPEFGSENGVPEVFDSHYNSDDGNTNSYWSTRSFRYATDEEKQRFLKELRSQCLYWNAYENEMERVGKRVQYGEKYLMINIHNQVVEQIEHNEEFDDKNYELGNYYLIEERTQAEKDAMSIKYIYKQRFENQY